MVDKDRTHESRIKAHKTHGGRGERAYVFLCDFRHTSVIERDQTARFLPIEMTAERPGKGYAALRCRGYGAE